MPSEIYLTAINFGLCFLWGGGAFMRLRASHNNVLCRVRLIYTGMLTAAAASGLQLQLFGEYAGYSDVLVSTTMVAFVLLGSKRWRYGVPSDLIKRASEMLH